MGVDRNQRKKNQCTDVIHCKAMWRLFFSDTKVKSVLCVADWAEKLTEMSRGKHHIGDFLPPEELEKFMETFNVRDDNQRN